MGFPCWVAGGTRTHDIQNHKPISHNRFIPLLYNKLFNVCFIFLRKCSGKTYMFLYNMLFLLIHSLPCFVIEKMMNNTHGMPIAIRPM